MALDAATEWDVRTTGNDNNGGGYKAGAGGTDFSQQNAAEDSGADLVIDDIDDTKVTSATHNFVAADVGNILNITAGMNFFFGRYEITACAGNAATLDRTCGIAGAAGGTWFYGGAIATLEEVDDVVVAGNTVHVKNGTYAEILDLETAGTISAEITWRGFNTSHNDSCLGTNRPLIDGGGVRANCLVIDQSHNRFENFRFTNSTADLVSCGSCWMTFENCKFSLAGDKTFDNNSPRLRMINCEVTTSTDDLSTDLAYYHIMSGVYSHDNSNRGFNTNRGGNIINCIADSNPDHGFRIGNADLDVISSHNIAYNNTGAATDGFQFDDNDEEFIFVQNCISKDNGNYGFYLNTIKPYYFDYNCYEGNGTPLGGFTAGSNDVTADPDFVDAPGGDFTVNAGSPVLSKGFPDDTWDELVGLKAGSDYEVNIGIDQDSNAAAGGGAGGGGWYAGE